MMTGLEKLLRWHSLRGGISTQDATATGNPATFTTTLVRPLKVCKANFAPVQAGSGTPSPENVRPISGWDGLTVYHSGADTSNPEEIAVTFGAAGTVYGGTVDLVTGVLTVTHIYKEFAASDFTQYYPSGTTYSDRICTAKALLPGVSTGSGNPQGAVIANNMLCDVNGAANTIKATDAPYMAMSGTSGNTSLFIMFPDSYSISSLTAGKEWITNNPTGAVFLLSTPQTVQLDPQTIRTLAGTNTVWSNANGNLEITYIKKG